MSAITRILCGPCLVRPGARSDVTCGEDMIWKSLFRHDCNGTEQLWQLRTKILWYQLATLMDSPSQGRWSGPGGPHDEPQPARGQSPRPPKLQLGAAAADGSLHPAETLDQPVLRSTPSGPGRTPHLSDSSDTGVFRASTVTQAGGLRVSLQSSAPAEGAPLCQTLLPACRQLSASFPPHCGLRAA